jgi:hypothetical protein
MCGFVSFDDVVAVTSLHFFFFFFFFSLLAVSLRILAFTSLYLVLIKINCDMRYGNLYLCFACVVSDNWNSITYALFVLY